MNTLLARAAVAVLSTSLAVPAVNASDNLHLLATVSHLQSQNANEKPKETPAPKPSQEVQSSAEKRLQDQRNELRRNWGG